MTQEIRGNTVGNIVNGGLIAKKDFYTEEGIFRYGGRGFYAYRSSDGHKLYTREIDLTRGGRGQKICDDPCGYINAIDGDEEDRWIYYVHMGDGGIYRIQDDGSRRELLCGGPGRCKDLSLVDDVLYWIEELQNAPSAIRRMPAEGGGAQTIWEGEACAYLNVTGGWMFFSNGSDENRLYKMQIDGSLPLKLSDDSCAYINALLGTEYGDGVYYRNDSDGGRLYVVSPDGSGRRKINNDAVRALNIEEGHRYSARYAHYYKESGDLPGAGLCIGVLTGAGHEEYHKETRFSGYRYSAIHTYHYGRIAQNDDFGGCLYLLPIYSDTMQRLDRDKDLFAPTNYLFAQAPGADSLSQDAQFIRDYLETHPWLAQPYEALKRLGGDGGQVVLNAGASEAEVEALTEGHVMSESHPPSRNLRYYLSPDYPGYLAFMESAFPDTYLSFLRLINGFVRNGRVYAYGTHTRITPVSLVSSGEDSWIPAERLWVGNYGRPDFSRPISYLCLGYCDHGRYLWHSGDDSYVLLLANGETHRFGNCIDMLMHMAYRAGE